MLRRNGKDLKTHAFLCAIQLEDDVSIEHVVNKLGEGVMFIEGVGTAEIEHLGEIDVYDEEPYTAPEEVDTNFLQGDVDVTKEEMH